MSPTPASTASDPLSSIDALIAALQTAGYFADRRLATAVFLALRLQRPLLLEGEPGVGKTELAKALAQVLGRELLRLQCYDGLEQREALYEWNYAAQLLHLRAAEGRGTVEEAEREVYQPHYLIRRPLLQALQAPAPGAVLLIDEVDRADEPFEAFLLEYLGEYQVSIPELGTVRAVATPLTVLTSNRTRELNDAVKRRCLYHWVEFPSVERELEIAARDRVADRRRADPSAPDHQRVDHQPRHHRADHRDLGGLRHDRHGDDGLDHRRRPDRRRPGLRRRHARPRRGLRRRHEQRPRHALHLDVPEGRLRRRPARPQGGV